MTLGCSLKESKYPLKDSVEWKLANNPISLAKEKNKFVFVWFYIDNCTSCDQMLSILNEINVTLNEVTIPIKFNIKNNFYEYEKLIVPAIKRNDLTVPSFCIISPNGKVFVVQGLVDKRSMLLLLNELKKI